MIFLSNVLKTWIFQKVKLKYDLSCTICKDEFLFYQKIWYFFGRIMNQVVCICISVKNMRLPFCQKKSKKLCPNKIHLNMIVLLD